MAKHAVQTCKGALLAVVMLCIAALTVAVVAMADGVEGDSAATVPYEEVAACSEQQGEGQSVVVAAEPVQDQDVLAGEPVVGDVPSDQDAAPAQGQPAEDMDVPGDDQGESGALAADAAEGEPMSGQPEVQDPTQASPDDAQAADFGEAVLGEIAQGYVDEANALVVQVEGLDPSAEGFEAALEELGVLIADLYDRWDASRAAGALSESDDAAVSGAVASLASRLGAVAGVDLGQTYADGLAVTVSGATQVSDGVWEIEVGSTMTASVDDLRLSYKWKIDSQTPDGTVSLEGSDSRTVTIRAQQAGVAVIKLSAGQYSVGTAAITVHVVPVEYNIVYDLGLASKADVLVGGSTAVDGLVQTSEGSYEYVDANNVDGTQPYTIKSLVGEPEGATQYYMVYESDAYKYYTFSGWKIANAGSTTWQSGSQLTANQLNEYGVDHTVTLTASWSSAQPQTSNENVYPTVNFYVHKDVVADRNDITIDGPSPANNWTDSVFSTTTNSAYIGGVPYVYTSAKGGEYLALSVPEDGDVRDTDADIRNLTGGVEVTYDSKSYVYKLADFPSDEHVFSQIRKQIDEHLTSITDAQGKVVASSDLTPDNYAIRWHVFKFSESDAWHVDGMLLQKAGKVNITKTFVGDAETIEAVKAGYSIAVEKSAGGANADTRTLMLDASLGGVAPTTGPVTGEGGEVTYTWTLEVDPGVEYVVRENGYDSPSDSIGVLAEYLVSSTALSEGGSAARDWHEYPAGGIAFTAQSYASDLPSSAYQTVVLRNSYLSQNSLTLFKYDQANGAGLGSATFELYKAGSDTPADLYKADGSYYLYEPAGQEFEKVTELAVNEGGYAVVLGLDGAGRFAGSYELREKTAPEGYAAGGAITLNFAADGTITKSDGPGTLKVVGGSGHTYQLDVPNSSLTVDVIAEKVWGSDVAEGDRQPVGVQLYNGAAPVSNTVYTLSSDNNWTVDLGAYPQYTGGSQADYRIVETKIGSTYRDPTADSVDGFRDYTVSYDAPAYSEVEGEKVLTLTVRNSKMPASSVTVGKQVTGNMGDVGETFSFTAECFYTTDEAGAVYIEPASPTVRDASGKVLSLNDIGYAVSTSDDGTVAVSFNLKAGYSATFPSVTNGNQFRVTETTKAAGYRTRVHLNGATTADSAWSNTDSVYEGAITVAAGSANSILFENNKEEQLGMGVSLTEGPFGLMVAGVLAAAVVGFVTFRVTHRGSCGGAHLAGRYY